MREENELCSRYVIDSTHLNLLETLDVIQDDFEKLRPFVDSYCNSTLWAMFSEEQRENAENILANIGKKQQEIIKNWANAYAKLICYELDIDTRSDKKKVKKVINKVINEINFPTNTSIKCIEYSVDGLIDLIEYF